MRFGILLPFALAFAPALLMGCKKDEPAQPKPTPEGVSSAISPLGSAKSKLPLRNAMAPVPKIEPQAMKDYRLEVCYFGTLTLRQARDAYLASLGKDEPSEKKIPNFGLPPTPTGASLAPPTAGSAGPAPAAPAPSSSAGAPPGGPKIVAPSTPGSAAAGRRMADLGLRAPHERNARACTVAAGLKDPAMPAVDEALKEFAPFALELSRNIAAASIYYQREEYSKDKFERGKELHKKLVADFAKLEELSDKLATAIAAHRKDHPADPSKMEEGEKVVFEAYESARGMLSTLVPKKVDPATYKASISTIEKSIEAIKAVGTKNPNDNWAKISAPAFDAFLKSVRDGEAKISDKGVLAPDAYLQIVNTFTAVIEAKHRALSRALIAKGQTIDPRQGPGGGARIPALRPGEPPAAAGDGHNHSEH